MPKRAKLTKRQQVEKNIRSEANGAVFAPVRGSGIFAERAKERRNRDIEAFVARRMAEWDKEHPEEAEAAKAAAEITAAVADITEAFEATL